MNYRPERVSSLIQEELGRLILREVEFEPGVLITITYVDVDKKLGRARVGMSVLSPSARFAEAPARRANLASGGPSEKAGEALKILGAAAGKLQWLLLKKINIKPMPQIIFEIDRGSEHAAEVEKALLEDNNK